MAKKVKMPFWLSALLGVLLGLLVILIVIAPQHDESRDHQLKQEQSKASAELEYQRQQQPANIPQQHKQPPLAATLKHQSASTAIAKKTHPPRPTPMQQQGHGIALVIDDVGYDLMAVKRILNLSVPVAISVLPNSPFARQAATLSKQAGQVVMLHLPMQPEDPSLQMGNGFLRANMSREDVRQTFLRDLKKVPYVEGTNNHMGSKLTQIDATMQWVMQLCRENNLFFLDSKTSPHSVAAHQARQAGIAWASRRIFLDHEMTLVPCRKLGNRRATVLPSIADVLLSLTPEPKRWLFWRTISALKMPRAWFQSDNYCIRAHSKLNL